MDELHDKSVLVVDDDPGMLRAMSKVLAGEGMQVTGVSDPVAVVKKLADSEKRFDVVITDLRMPMFSGRGVLALASALPELPVIIITAFGGPDVEAQALRLGAFASQHGVHDLQDFSFAGIHLDPVFFLLHAGSHVSSLA